jgi:hypothetical protein
MTGASAERRQALASLVRNPDIEAVVQQTLGERLPEGFRTRGALLGMVEGRLAPRSELISIVVTAPERELADLVAGAWARAYEQHVNRLYADSPGGSSADLALKVQEAEQVYARAEAAYTSLIETSPLAELTRQLDRKLQVLADFQLQAQELSRTLRRTELLLGNARALQHQLDTAADPGVAATSASVLTLLKMQAFTELMATPHAVPSSPAAGSASAPNSISGSVSGPVTGSSTAGSTAGLQPLQAGGGLVGATSGVQVQISPSAISLTSARDDSRAIVVALEARRAQLQSDLLLTLSASGTTGGDASAAGSGLAMRVLQQERALALESYSSLLKRLEEGRVLASLGSGREVAVANSTPLMAETVRTSLIRRMVLGAGLGIVLAAVGVTVLALGSRVNSPDAPMYQSRQSGEASDAEANGQLRPSAAHAAPAVHVVPDGH